MSFISKLIGTPLRTKISENDKVLQNDKLSNRFFNAEIPESTKANSTAQIYTKSPQYTSYKNIALETETNNKKEFENNQNIGLYCRTPEQRNVQQTLKNKHNDFTKEMARLQTLRETKAKEATEKKTKRQEEAKEPTSTKREFRKFIRNGMREVENNANASSKKGYVNVSPVDWNGVINSGHKIREK